MSEVLKFYELDYIFDYEEIKIYEKDLIKEYDEYYNLKSFDKCYRGGF